LRGRPEGEESDEREEQGTKLHGRRGCTRLDVVSFKDRLHLRGSLLIGFLDSLDHGDFRVLEGTEKVVSGDSSPVVIDGEERKDEMSRVRAREMIQDEILKIREARREEEGLSRERGRRRGRRHGGVSFDVVGEREGQLDLPLFLFSSPATTLPSQRSRPTSSNPQP